MEMRKYGEHMTDVSAHDALRNAATARKQNSSDQSKLIDYYSLVWAQIKERWTLPEDPPTGKTNLDTIIVVVIEREGKIQKTWFEKKSGNVLYDQMALQAIKKAEPFPPLPKELGETVEIGIRFHPE